MAAFAFLHRARANWQIRRAIKQLVHPDEVVRDSARARLRDVSPSCWPQLRRTAFRPRTRLAVIAADLLDQFGDRQGLIALLSQFADMSMHSLYNADIRRSLYRIGTERIAEVLEHALERVQGGNLMRHDWALSVSVYALYALQNLKGALPAHVWLRALTAAQPYFEDLRVCRSVLPAHSFADLTETSARPPSDDWRVGATLVAVRRAAVEALITLSRTEAFELLRVAIGNNDPQVQCTAIYGLRRLRDPRALVLLQRIAADRRHPLARDARRAIEAFGTRQPDSLTLVRASDSLSATPDQLLRAADARLETAPETLLRAVSEEQNAPRPPLVTATETQEHEQIETQRLNT